ncbi:MAG: 50S ribosomal protein L10 [Patescibacteria group bacterium]
MKTFQQKKEELASAKAKLIKSKIVVFSSFARDGESGLSVSAMRNLKKELRAVDSEYVVAKKTILDKVFKDSKSLFKIVDDSSAVDVFQYQGSVGAVFGYGDEQSVARSVYTFAKKNPAFKYFGALQAGKFMDFIQLTEFAKLPSKEVMIARLLGMMKYPIAAFAVVLDQISKKKSMP